MNGNIPDTFWTTQEELLLFGGACLLGFPAGILFDCFRLIRRLFPKHHPLLVAAEDFVWVTAVCVMLLFYASAFAKGIFRGYYAAGCAICFILYECTLGRAAVFVLEKVFRLIYAPFHLAGRGIVLICTKIKKIFVNSTQKCRNGQENTQKPLQKPTGIVYNNHRTRKKGMYDGKKSKRR